MNSPQALAFKELPPSRQWALYWWFLWRVMIMTLCSMIAGAVLGGLFGFVIGIVSAMSGADHAETLQFSRVVGGILGLGCGMFAWWHFVRWIFNARFGNYRLRLVQETADTAEQVLEVSGGP